MLLEPGWSYLVRAMHMYILRQGNMLTSIGMSALKVAYMNTMSTFLDGNFSQASCFDDCIL